MSLLRYSCILLLALLFTNSWADQLIVEPEMGRAPIINMINDTQHALHLVMYGFTDEAFLNPILQQKRRNKTVQIILERTPYKNESENVKTISAFEANNISWQDSVADTRLIHQKTLIIDGRKALVMTFNFTKSAFKKQRNFALVVDDAKTVNDIEQLFSADWNHISYDNVSSRLILSPNDSREKLITLIHQARRSIKVYAQNINDYKIIGALANAARKGAKVQILTSSKMRDKQENYLSKAGVEIDYSKKMMIHAKVFIIDDNKAVLGSINLTRASLDDNRELSIVTEDRAVVKQLTQTFNSDLAGTEKLSARFTFDDKKMKRLISAAKLLLSS